MGGAEPREGARSHGRGRGATGGARSHRKGAEPQGRRRATGGGAEPQGRRGATGGGAEPQGEVWCVMCVCDATQKIILRSSSIITN